MTEAETDAIYKRYAEYVEAHWGNDRLGYQAWLERELIDAETRLAHIETRVRPLAEMFGLYEPGI